MCYKISRNKIVVFLITFAFGLSLYSLIHLINNRAILENTSVNIVKTKENNSNQITNSNILNLESKCNPIDEDIKKYRHEEIKIFIDKIEREKKSQTKHKLLYIRFVLEREYLYSELNLIKENNSNIECFEEIKQLENRIEDIKSIVKRIENSKNVDSLLQQISNFEN